MDDDLGDFSDHGRKAANLYQTTHASYVGCARQIQDLLTHWLDAEGINYLGISARAKSVESFQTKASKPSDEGGAPKYLDPLADITDLIGARVITYLPESVDRTCEILRTELRVEEDVDKGERTRQRGGFGYASLHFLARLDQNRARSREYKSIGNKLFEVQVRTAAQHAWAEFEHDVRYKVSIPENRRPEFDRRLTLAAALVELADAEFTAIDQLYREVAQVSVQEARAHSNIERARPGRPGQPSTAPSSIERPLDAAGLAAYLAERYRDAPKSKKEHYAWMLELLRSCDVTSLDQLDALLDGVNMAAVNQTMRHQFAAGHVRRLDDDLLASLGEKYITQSASVEDRTELLRARLAKLRPRRSAR